MNIHGLKLRLALGRNEMIMREESLRELRGKRNISKDDRIKINLLENIINHITDGLNITRRKIKIIRIERRTKKKK